MFAIALVTYTMTQEATVSLWDCGEFVPASYKLEVVHPPGAPFFLMLNHFFTIVAKIAGNTSLVADMVNFSSALMSALTILFLFWTITALAAKMVFSKAGEAIKLDQLIAVLGAAVVGALAYTWSDTFWFSAVEGEVYAMSSMFIALVSWLMMKWERRADEPGNARWIVLICFFIGLSSGVHLMSLLAMPAMAVVYYYRKYKNHTWQGLVIAGLIGVVLLGLVQVGVVTGIPTIMAFVERTFVNSFGMPFWSGVFVFLILLIGLFTYAIYYTYKKAKQTLHIIAVCAAVIFVGYSSYAMVVIRSLANPAIDMNDPQDVYSLLSYLNREQYGDRPIVKGPNFDAFLDWDSDGYPDGITGMKEEGKIYRKGEEKYEFVDTRKDYEYNKKFTTVFPRMGSNQGDHAEGYQRWSGLKQQQRPLLKDNIKFFFNYQVNHMWWRYFAWNFIGRQNDIQGHGSSLRGNDITGIGGIDEVLFDVPNSDKLPDGFKNDKSRNVLYGIPFLLGMLGFFFQMRKDRNSFFYILVYFIMTGLALAVYLNMPPYQPRERDYVFAGSFYFFSVWIGLGALMIYDWLRTKISPNLAAGGVMLVCFLVVPLKMLSEEWDDHDRSNREVPLAFGRNYLESCPPNAILFTNGDNDTYPLWYAQEVENIRPDIRIINMSLLNTDWYVNQQRRPINESAPVEMSMDPLDYQQGSLDMIEYDKSAVSIYNQSKSGKQKLSGTAHYELANVIDFIKSKDRKNMLRNQSGGFVNFLPSKNFKVKVNKDDILSNGIISKEQAPFIADAIKWTVRKNRLMKADLVLLDIIATNAKNGWDRPICWAITTGNDVYQNLMPYLRMEGLVYRLVPMRRYVVTGKTINHFQNSANKVEDQIRKLEANPQKNKKRIAKLQGQRADFYQLGNALYGLYGKLYYTEKEYRKEVVKAIGDRALVDRYMSRILNFTESNDVPGTAGFVGTDVMYENVMEDFSWGGLESEEDMWVDYVMMRSARNLRTVFSRLAQSMLNEANKEEQLLRDSSAAAALEIPELQAFSPAEKRKKAIEVLDKGMESIPETTVPYSYLYMWNEMLSYSQLYYDLGEKEKAFAIDEKLLKGLSQELYYFLSFDREYRGEVNPLIQQNIRTMEQIIKNAATNELEITEWRAKLKDIKQINNPNAKRQNQQTPLQLEQEEGAGDVDAQPEGQ